MSMMPTEISTFHLASLWSWGLRKSCEEQKHLIRNICSGLLDQDYWIRNIRSGTLDQEHWIRNIGSGLWRRSTRAEFKTSPKKRTIWFMHKSSVGTKCSVNIRACQECKQPSFHRIGPLGRFDHRVAMSVCVSVCLWSVDMCVPFPCDFLAWS